VRIISEIICAGFAVVEAQMKLLKAKIANMVSGIIFFAAALVFALSFIAFLSVGCYLVMAPRVGPPAAAFITAGIMLVISLALVLVGKGKMA
jgi:hypothetical protein